MEKKKNLLNVEDQGVQHIKISNAALEILAN
jgi:hypothetical protein